MEPPPYAEGSYPHRLYHLAGPGLVFLFSLVMLLVYRMSFPRSILRLASAYLGLVGLFGSFWSAYPVAIENRPNDGLNVLRATKDPTEKWYQWVLLKVMAELGQGRRLKEMPREYFLEGLPELPLKTSDVSLATFTIHYYLDERHFSEAIRLSDFVLHYGDMEQAAKSLLYLNRYYLELIGARDPDVLRTSWQEARWIIQTLPD